MSCLNPQECRTVTVARRKKERKRFVDLGFKKLIQSSSRKSRASTAEQQAAGLSSGGSCCRSTMVEEDAAAASLPRLSSSGKPAAVDGDCCCDGCLGRVRARPLPRSRAAGATAQPLPRLARLPPVPPPAQPSASPAQLSPATFCAVSRFTLSLGACFFFSARFVGRHLRMQQRWPGCCRAASRHHSGSVQLVFSACFQIVE